MREEYEHLKSSKEVYQSPAVNTKQTSRETSQHRSAAKEAKSIKHEISLPSNSKQLSVHSTARDVVDVDQIGKHI